MRTQQKLMKHKLQVLKGAVEDLRKMKGEKLEVTLLNPVAQSEQA